MAPKFPEKSATKLHYFFGDRHNSTSFTYLTAIVSNVMQVTKILKSYQAFFLAAQLWQHRIDEQKWRVQTILEIQLFWTR